MAKCIMCGRGGKIFGPSLSKEGLCRQCDSLYGLELTQCGRILMDSVKIVSNTKNIETLVSRIDLILEKASKLVKYEKLNLETVEPPPSQILRDFQKERDEYIIDILNDDLTKVVNKLQLSPTISKINREYAKIFDKLEDAREHFREEENVKKFEIEVKTNYRKIVIKTHLDNGKKAHFKGQNKKAKESYFEALYFIENEDISQDSKNEIKNKITDLIEKIED